MIPILKKSIEYLKNQYAIDARSISIFRISIGIVLICDLLMRLPEVGSFYTDNGVLPRSIELSNSINYFRFSIHHMFGSTFGQVIIFILHISLSFIFIVGLRTRLLAFVLWVLTASLHSRNYLVLQSGDTALRLFLFWSIFMPIQGIYSLDSFKSTPKILSTKVFTPGVLGILTQIGLIYYFAGYEKSYEVYFKTGDALRLAMNLERYSTSVGQFLLAFPELLKFMSRVSYISEILCPIFLIIPFKNWIFRTTILIIFMLFHIGTILMMEVGFFPFISMTMWTLLIPSQFFDWLLRLKKLSPAQMTINSSSNFLWKKIGIIFLCVTDIKFEFKKSKETSFHHNGRDLKEDEFISILIKYSVFYTPQTRKILIKFINFFFYLSSFKFKYQLQFKKVQSTIFILIGMFFVVYNVLLNLRPYKFTSSQTKEFIKKIEEIDVLKHGFNFEQRWGMFSPYPSKSDGWHIIYGERYSGNKVDLWGTDFRYPKNKPKNVASTYRNQRWRKYLDTIVRESHKGYRPYFLQHICYEINKNKKNSRLKLKKIYHRYVEELTLDKGVAPLKEIDYGSVTCLK